MVWDILMRMPRYAFVEVCLLTRQLTRAVKCGFIRWWKKRMHFSGRIFAVFSVCIQLKALPAMMGLQEYPPWPHKLGPA